MFAIVGSDFNFPNISQQDGYANIDPSSTYGTDIDQIFVGTISHHIDGLQQLISAPIYLR